MNGLQQSEGRELTEQGPSNGLVLSPGSGGMRTAFRPKKCTTDLLTASWAVGYTLAVGLARLHVIEEQQHVLWLFPPELGPDLMPAPAIEYSHRLSSLPASFARPQPKI